MTDTLDDTDEIDGEDIEEALWELYDLDPDEWNEIFDDENDEHERLIYDDDTGQWYDPETGEYLDE